MITENDIEESHKRLNDKIASITDKANELLESWKAVNDLSKCQEISTISDIFTAAVDKQIARLDAVTKLDDDQVRREIHIFNDITLMSAMLFQIRYLDKNGGVASYGDLFLAGRQYFYGIGNNDDDLVIPWTRIPVPFGCQINEAVSDGLGIWLIDKEREKIFYIGGQKEINSNNSNRLSHGMRQFHFPKKVKKIAVGKMTHYSGNSSYYPSTSNHIAIIVTDDGKAYGFGNNQSGTISYPGNTTWIGTPQEIHIKYSDQEKDDLKIVDAVVVNCGYTHNAAVFVCEHTKDEQVANRKILFGSGKNITNIFGEGVSTSETPQRLFITHFGGHPKHQAWKVWAVASSNYYNNDSYVYATLYVSVGDAEQGAQLYACGYGKEGQISRTFDKNSNGGKTRDLTACTPATGSGFNMTNIVDIKGIGYKSITVARDSNKHLYIAGKLSQQICKVDSGETEGFTKITIGTAGSALECDDFWIYGPINRWNSDRDSDTKPYLVWYHSGGDPGFFHSGWDFADGSSGKMVTGYSNQYYSQLPGDYLINPKKGICLSTRDYDNDNYGFILYGASLDGRYILVRGRTGKWNKGEDSAGNNTAVFIGNPETFVPAPGMPLI